MRCHASRKEVDDAKQKIIFYALCVLYVLSVACITLDTAYFVVASVSNNAAFSFFDFALTLSCAHRAMMMSLYSSAWAVLLSLYYSVAVTLSPNAFLYAQLTTFCSSIPFILFYFPSNLQKIHRCWIVWGCNTPCRDRSFHISIRILRSVNLS